MSRIRMTARTQAGLAAVVFIGFVSILSFGRTILSVAESTASCMRDAQAQGEDPLWAERQCGRVDPWEFWGPIAIVSGLSFFVGGLGCIFGQRHRGDRGAVSS